jgi:hypothetical protein
MTNDSECDDFKALRGKLLELRAGYAIGRVPFAEVEAMAVRAAAAFNREATEIARRMKVRPRLITTASLIR